MKDSEKIENRGGKRIGSGRKTGSILVPQEMRKKNVTFRISPNSFLSLKMLAKQLKKPTVLVLEDAIALISEKYEKK